MAKKLPFTTILFTILALTVYSSCYSQDNSWWIQKHNAQNVSPWYKLLNVSAAYFGPNALPVPNIKNGKTPDASYVKLGVEGFRSKGDDTNSTFAEFYVPLFSNRVGLHLQMHPFEHYKMDTITRDIRKSRDYDGKGTAVGDLYIGTYIQLLKNDSVWPDMLLTINIKTASGMNLDAVRYTDTPGYFFDYSLGKNFYTNGLIQYIRPHAMTGFYVYQTYHQIYKQNDCFLYGFGVDFATKKINLTSAIGGYNGYIGNGDHPMVFRATLSSNFNSRLNFDIRYQKGLHDYDYNSIRLCCVIRL